MSTRLASFMLLYGGQLAVNEDRTPRYSGGRNRPLEVPRGTKLSDMKVRVLRTLKYDITRYTMNLICRMPVGHEFIATHVEDEDIWRIIMRKAISEFLVLYVEIEEINEIPMHDPINIEGTAQPFWSVNENEIDFASTSQQQPEHVEIPTSTPYLSLLQDPSEELMEAQLNVAEGYETMNSESSGSTDDDADGLNSEREREIQDEGMDDIIRNYAFGTVNLEDNIRSNNEYLTTVQTTEEWDASIEIDESENMPTTEVDLTIPSELYEGMCFKTKRDLQFAIQGWSILNNVQYEVVASNSIKFTISCVKSDVHSRPCNWRLHSCASRRLGGVWKISTLKSDHSCTNPILIAGHKNCTSNFIAHFIVPSIRRQIDLKPKEIIGRIEAKFNIKVSYIKAWDARRKAIKKIFGSWEASYQTLYLFMEAINYAMPGSVYRIKTIEANKFQRLFWAFRPCIEGWMFCRPVLSLDGTFLLGKYRGTLLTAIGVDANNGLFPLAFAIVESECNESWFWFFRCLLELIPQIFGREDLCIISDRHAGLVRACRELIPWAAHRSCLRHLRENFKKAIRRMGIADVEFLCQKMYQAGSTPDIRVYNRLMTDIRNIKEEAYVWLVEHDIVRWSLTHDKGFRYGAMTTNAAESFNGVLKRARGLPIQALITSIYYNIIGIFLKRRDAISNDEGNPDNILCKTPLNMILSSEQESRRLPEPTRINQQEFQVFDMSGITYRVDIIDNRDCRCQCGRPEIYHIPCAHVISCLSVLRRSHYQFVSEYYTTNNLRSTYAADFHSIPDKSNWGIFDRSMGLFPLMPPNIKRRSGRPRSRRYKNTMDESTAVNTRKCSHCNVRGHNITTCPRR